jgi:sec-independent protein translocase protein TatC
MGLVTHGFLIRKQRIAIVLIAITAAVITPTPDIPTMLLFAGPMVALYWLSIAVAWVFRRRTP